MAKATGYIVLPTKQLTGSGMPAVFVVTAANGTFNPAGDGQTISPLSSNTGDIYAIVSNCTLPGIGNTNAFQPTGNTSSFSFSISSIVQGKDPITFSNNFGATDVPPVNLYVSIPQSPNNYCNGLDIEDIFGPYNTAIWSQLDPSIVQGTPDYNRYTVAMGWADSKIVDYFRELGNYVSPLAPEGSAVAIVKNWCAQIAGIWLYQNRGTRDTAEDHKYTTMLMKVYEDMAYHTTVRKLDASKRWPSPTAPMGY